MPIYGGLFDKRSNALIFSAVNNKIGGAIAKIDNPILRGGSTSSVSARTSRTQLSFSLVTKSDNSLHIKNGNVSAKISNNAPTALTVLSQTFNAKNKSNNAIQVKTGKTTTPKAITPIFAQALKSKFNNFEGIVVKN